jgi:uncharacterized membrane protein YoaK (UPF0700 family)
VFAQKGPSRLTTATVVTVTTGMIEAVSFVGLGYVFTAMMTGNLLFIGFDLAGVSSSMSQNISLTGSVVALAAFAFGPLTGRRVNGVLAGRTDRWLALVTLLKGLVFLLAAVVAIGLRGHPDHLTARHLLVIVVLAATMGWRSATARRVAVPGHAGDAGHRVADQAANGVGERSGRRAAFGPQSGDQGGGMRSA